MSLLLLSTLVLVVVMVAFYVVEGVRRARCELSLLKRRALSRVWIVWSLELGLGGSELGYWYAASIAGIVGGHGV